MSIERGPVDIVVRDELAAPERTSGEHQHRSVEESEYRREQTNRNDDPSEQDQESTRAGSAGPGYEGRVRRVSTFE
jgi:hypothetical protein